MIENNRCYCVHNLYFYWLNCKRPFPKVFYAVHPKGVYHEEEVIIFNNVLKYTTHVQHIHCSMPFTKDTN